LLQEKLKKLRFRTKTTEEVRSVRIEKKRDIITRIAAKAVQETSQDPPDRKAETVNELETKQSKEFK
jgi:hypothetical protein